jgi:hypothetical protein
MDETTIKETILNVFIKEKLLLKPLNQKRFKLNGSFRA